MFIYITNLLWQKNPPLKDCNLLTNIHKASESIKTVRTQALEVFA